MGFLSSLGAKIVLVLALLAAAVASYWFTFNMGNLHGINSVLVENQKETIRKLNERVSANSALADSYRLQAEQDVLNHEKELADVRALAKRNTGKRVQIDPDQFCGPATSTETAKAGSTESTNPRTAALPEPFANDLRQLATEADEITAAYRTLRERSAACFN